MELNTQAMSADQLQPNIRKLIELVLDHSTWVQASGGSKSKCKMAA
jgi:hypothetical protein